MRLPRFTLLQLFLATAFVALFAGWLTQAWRAAQEAMVRSAALSADGQWVALASGWPNRIEVWSIGSNQPRLHRQRFSPGDSSLQGMQFIDGDALLLHQWRPTGSELVRWDFVARRERTVAQPGRPGNLLLWFSVSRDGRYAVTPNIDAVGGASATVGPRTLDVWDLRSGKRLHELPVGVEAFLPVHIDSVGETFATLAIGTQTPGVRDLSSGEFRCQFPEAYYNNLDLSADGRTIALAKLRNESGSFRGQDVALYDVPAQQQPRCLLRFHEGTEALQLSADGSRLLVVLAEAVEVWNTATRER